MVGVIVPIVRSLIAGPLSSQVHDTDYRISAFHDQDGDPKLNDKVNVSDASMTI